MASWRVLAFRQADERNLHLFPEGFSQDVSVRAGIVEIDGLQRTGITGQIFHQGMGLVDVSQGDIIKPGAGQPLPAYGNVLRVPP